MEKEVPNKILFCGVARSGKSTLAENLYREFGHMPMSFAEKLKAAAQVVFGFSHDHLYGSSSKRETPYKQFPFSGNCPQCRTRCEDPGRFLSPSSYIPEGIYEQYLALFEDRVDYWRCSRCGETYGKYITPRLACQTLGTEWGRGLCTDLWALSTFIAADAHSRVAITDGRFANEIMLAKEQGYVTVLLLRGLQDSTSTHPSERYIREMGVDAMRNENGNADLFDIILDNREGEIADNYKLLVEALRTNHVSPVYSSLFARPVREPAAAEEE